MKFLWRAETMEDDGGQEEDNALKMPVAVLITDNCHVEIMPCEPG